MSSRGVKSTWLRQALQDRGKVEVEAGVYVRAKARVGFRVRHRNRVRVCVRITFVVSIRDMVRTSARVRWSGAPGGVPHVPSLFLELQGLDTLGSAIPIAN